MNVAWCLLAFAAMWMLTRTLPGQGAIAPFLLSCSAAVVLLSLVDDAHSPVMLGVPALMLVPLMIPGERSRLLAAGVVFAACLVTAGWRWTTDGRIALARALALLAAALAPAVLLPLGGEGLGPAAIAGIGAIAIVVAASDARRVGLDVVMIAYCTALAAPSMPVRSSLFAFILAALVLLLRRPGAFTAGLFVLLVLAAGKWYLPILLAVAAGFAVQRYRTTREVEPKAGAVVVVPFTAAIPVAGISALAVAPDAWSRARQAGVATTVAAVLLAAGSLIVQPSLATLYAIAAIVCIVGVGGGGRWSIVLLSFVLVMSGLTAWSGSISGAFPLPLSFAVIVLLALGAWAGAAVTGGGSGALVHFRSAAVAGLAVLLVLMHAAPVPGREAIAADLRIAAGHPVLVPLPSATREVRIQISGGNVAGMKGGTVVGIVRAEPGGESRELRIGDLADWGLRRRAHYLSANNPRPLEPAGPVLGMGREAFLSGSGVVRLEANGATSLRIEALPAIGETGRLLVDSVEVEK